MLNLGGLANPDVYVIERGGLPVVVKDYARRAAWVRWLIAPWLVRREDALLRRADGVPGVPRGYGRVEGLAIALEYLDGEPLRRRTLAQTLPPTFFASLEAILEGLAERGLLYTDLRSPANVLYTPQGTPALVDLGSALRAPVPARVRAWLYRRALAKLRRRFEGDLEPLRASSPTTVDLHAGAVRIRLLDRGPVGDPTPLVALPDAGLSAVCFADLLERAAQRGRRALAVELPGFGGSRAADGEDPSPAAHATWLLHALDRMHLPRVDLLACGWAGLAARELALRAPGRVRALLTLDAPVRELRGRFRAAWRCALDTPEELRGLLRARTRELRDEVRSQVEARLEHVPARALARAYASVPLRQGKGCVDELALELPRVPWLALQSDADAVESPHPEGPRIGRTGTPLDAELLLEELAALGSAVPGASVR